MGHWLLWLQARVEHELVHGLIILCEFPLLLLVAILRIKVLVLVVPDLAPVVFVAEALVIDNEVVITSGVLFALVFVPADLFKDLLYFFDLDRVKIGKCCLPRTDLCA